LIRIEPNFEDGILVFGFGCDAVVGKDGVWVLDKCCGGDAGSSTKDSQLRVGESISIPYKFSFLLCPMMVSSIRMMSCAQTIQTRWLRILASMRKSIIAFS
jgi:hypothetical protein